MREALPSTTNPEITIKQSLALKNRVVFFRDPIERLHSLFNMMWDLAINNSGYGEIAPIGTIMAYGGRSDGEVSLNQHHWNDSKRQAYLNREAVEKGKGKPDAEVVKGLNQEDWKRLVDHVLSSRNTDSHWGVQHDLCSSGERFLPNIAHLFTTQEQVAADWSKYCATDIQTIGRTKTVPVDDYRLADLRAFYKKDLDFITDIGRSNGTWNPSR